MAIVLTAEGRERAHEPRGRRFKSCPRYILEHIMALHVCTTLGDALWRSEADLPLLLPRSGGGTPADYVDELATPLTTVDAEKSILVVRKMSAESLACDANMANHLWRMMCWRTERSFTR
jgi:hypothetical protein